MKKMIRLTESEFNSLIRDSVKAVLNEDVHTTDVADMMGMNDNSGGMPTNGPDSGEILYNRALGYIVQMLKDGISNKQVYNKLVDVLQDSF